MTFRILIPIGCRSDEGLSAPVIRRLKEQDWCEVQTCRLFPQDFGNSYMYVQNWIATNRPDLVLITGDRVEMCAPAAAAFHNKVRIAHLYAGITNDPITTFDDINRHCITLWSDIQFVENGDAYYFVIDLLTGIKQPNSYEVGITHLDDLEVDESKVPGEPYELILINHEPLQKKINWMWDRRGDIQEIHIGSNPDAQLGEIFGARSYYPNLPRPQFLGLLKNCRRFITNSSAAYYEAPYFLKPEQIIMVGNRNRNRGKVECKPGGSDKIVEVLRQYAESIQ